MAWQCKTPYAWYEQYNPAKLEHAPEGIWLVISLWILLWGAPCNHRDICFNRYHCRLWRPCFHSWFFHNRLKWLIHMKSSSIYTDCRQMEYVMKKKMAWDNSHIWCLAPWRCIIHIYDNWLKNMALHNSHIWYRKQTGGIHTKHV